MQMNNFLVFLLTFSFIYPKSVMTKTKNVILADIKPFEQLTWTTVVFNLN